MFRVNKDLYVLNAGELCSRAHEGAQRPDGARADPSVGADAICCRRQCHQRRLPLRFRLHGRRRRRRCRQRRPGAHDGGGGSERAVSGCVVPGKTATLHFDEMNSIDQSEHYAIPCRSPYSCCAPLKWSNAPSPASGPPPKERHSRDFAKHGLDNFCSAGFPCSSAIDRVDGGYLGGCDGSLVGITRAFPSYAFLFS